MDEALAEKRYAEKTSILKRHKIDTDFEKVKTMKEEIQRLSKLDVTQVSDEYFDKMDQEQDRMIESLNSRIPFINHELTDFVPFSYPNLLLIGAKTGDGKSTAAANIVYGLLAAKDEKTGKDHRVLVISNEEMAITVMNRVICLDEGWNLNRQKTFSEAQHNKLRQRRRELGQSGRIRVIDSEFPEFKDATTTYEGLKFILENAYEAYKNGGEPYSAIIIDYFQKISSSKENSKSSTYEVLKKVTDLLDGFYKKYPAPIVIFSQVKPEAKEETDFEYRIKECKAIYVASTHALEISPNKRLSASEFVCHKHRFSSDERGSSITAGWEAGRFVEYTDEFRAATAMRLTNAEHNATMRKAGVNRK